MGASASVARIAREAGEHWGPEYGPYLTRDGDELIILFRGGTKKRQQADIDRAGEWLAEYKVRKAAAKKAKK